MSWLIRKSDDHEAMDVKKAEEVKKGVEELIKREESEKGKDESSDIALLKAVVTLIDAFIGHEKKETVSE